MTLTTPNCPVAESLPKQVKEYIWKLRGNRRRIKTSLGSSMDQIKMSEAAKLELNL